MVRWWPHTMKIGIKFSYFKYLCNSYRLLLTIAAQTHITPSLLLLGLIVSATAANSIIFFAGTETRIVYSELIIIASASFAAFLGILLAYRQILHNRSHSKGYICLAIGLVLWLSADVIWASYELVYRSEEHTSELQSRQYLVCRLLLEKKKK